MARSQYIYVVIDSRISHRSATPQAVFTVKRQAIEWLQALAAIHLSLWRMGDAGYGHYGSMWTPQPDPVEIPWMNA